jgi:hypothetical protein
MTSHSPPNATDTPLMQGDGMTDIADDADTSTIADKHDRSGQGQQAHGGRG